MTVEEALGWVINLLETFGPWVLGIYGAFFLIVFGFVVTVFVLAFKETRRGKKRRKLRDKRNRSI